MFISYFSLLLFTCILGSMTNYLRYQVNFSLNKWILTISSILLMVINSFWINPTSQINMILFILVTAYCFKLTGDRKSTRLNSSHVAISYAVFCLKKKRQHALMTKS